MAGVFLLYCRKIRQDGHIQPNQNRRETGVGAGEQHRGRSGHCSRCYNPSDKNSSYFLKTDLRSGSLTDSFTYLIPVPDSAFQVTHDTDGKLRHNPTSMQIENNKG